MSDIEKKALISIWSTSNLVLLNFFFNFVFIFNLITRFRFRFRFRFGVELG